MLRPNITISDFYQTPDGQIELDLLLTLDHVNEDGEVLSEMTIPLSTNLSEAISAICKVYPDMEYTGTELDKTMKMLETVQDQLDDLKKPIHEKRQQIRDLERKYDWTKI